MKWIAPITFLVFIVATCITIFFVKALKPTTVVAFAFYAVWLILPYVVIGTALILLWHKRIASVHWHILAVMVSVGGIVFLTDVIFWHPDAQGAIAVLMTPILQGGVFAILLPLASRIWRYLRE